MAKVKVIDKKSEKSIKAEREFLQKLKHPFIVNMHSAFQDYENLYLVMDLLNGGDLRYHLSRKKRFTEEQTSKPQIVFNNTVEFFIGCILVGLEYIHSKKVIHRDIKPENLVLDDNGYVHITDFGVAKYYALNNSHETSGTPGYMSPEVMRGQNHSYSVDFYGVGVIAFEFMTGKRPYLGKSRKDIKEQIMAKQVEIKYSFLPEGWSKEAADFINQLIQRKPEQRLGHKNIREIFEHPWLSSFPFKSLLQKQIISPYIPEKKDNFDKKYCEGIEKIGLDTNNRYDKIMEGPNFTSLFEKFTYYGRDNDEEYSSNNKKSKYYNSFINKSNTISNKKRCQSANVNDIKIIETFTSGFYSNPNQSKPKKKSSIQLNQKINKIPCPSTSVNRTSKHSTINSTSSQSFKSTSALKNQIKKYDESKAPNEIKVTGLTKNVRMNSENIMPHSRGGNVLNPSYLTYNGIASYQRSNSNLGDMSNGTTTTVTRNVNYNINNTLSTNTPNNTNNFVNNKINRRNRIALTSITSFSANSLNNPNSSTMNAQGNTVTNNYSVSSNTVSTNNNTTKPYSKKQTISKSSNSFLTIKINSVTSPTHKVKKQT